MLEYTPIPQTLLDLHEELDGLGGGDTRISRAEVICKITDDRKNDATVFTTDVEGEVSFFHPERRREILFKFNLTCQAQDTVDDVFDMIGAQLFLAFLFEFPLSSLCVRF